MTLNVTVSISGPEDEIRGRLPALIQLLGANIDVTVDEEPRRLPHSEALGKFADGLTESGAAVVRQIAMGSLEDRPMPRPDLVKFANLRDDTELNGVLGGVGIHWARWFDEPNPFLNHYVRAAGASVYYIDKSLAHELLALLS